MTALAYAVIGCECMSLRHSDTFRAFVRSCMCSLQFAGSSLALAHQSNVHTVEVSNVACLCLFWHISTIHTLHTRIFFASLVSHVQNRSLHHCRSSLSVTAWFWFYVFRQFSVVGGAELKTRKIRTRTEQFPNFRHFHWNTNCTHIRGYCGWAKKFRIEIPK